MNYCAAIKDIPKIKSVFVILSLLLSIKNCVIAQERSKMFTISKIDGKPLDDVNVTINYGTNIEHTISDKAGNFMVEKPDKVVNMTLSCIGFKSQSLKPPYPEKIILDVATIVLEEVQINKLRKDLTTSLHLSYDDYQVTFIPSKYDDVNQLITVLRYNTVDILGVKGLKYLPFYANIFSVDTITGLPGLKLLPDIIAKRVKNSKWVEVDISKYNIRVPKEGVFISVQILNETNYKVSRIQSEIGLITPVPTFKIKPRENGKKSFISVYGKAWEEQRETYEMDFLYK